MNDNIALILRLLALVALFGWGIISAVVFIIRYFSMEYEPLPPFSRNRSELESMLIRRRISKFLWFPALGFFAIFVFNAVLNLLSFFPQSLFLGMDEYGDSVDGRWTVAIVSAIALSLCVIHFLETRAKMQRAYWREQANAEVRKHWMRELKMTYKPFTKTLAKLCRRIEELEQKWPLDEEEHWEAGVLAEIHEQLQAISTSIHFEAYREPEEDA